MKKNIAPLALTLSLLPAQLIAAEQGRRPNILFVIADDQSCPDASAYGSKMVHTPGFDEVAAAGVLFSRAYVTSPGSSPSRASILTGMYPWQIEEAGTHASSFSTKYVCYPDLLKEVGYKIGYTGKGWGPGDWKVSGRPYNPAGPEYNEVKLDPPYDGISKIDYTENFKRFLDERNGDTPFCFWLGTHEPHRPYENMSWVKAGDSLAMAEPREFMPDAAEVRGDLLDYAQEIEWFDSHLAKCIAELKKRGEFDNTIIIVTADNGMSFPHAKANCYDAGVHVPLAICWGDKIKPGQKVDQIVSSIDFAPTLLEATGVQRTKAHVGQSLLPLMQGKQKAYSRTAAYSSRERHSCSRHDNMGYPMRSVRWGNYILVHNEHSERYPAGDPCEMTKSGKNLKPMHEAYYDIDAAPSKDYIIAHRDEPAVKPFFEASVGKRPEFELFDLTNDEACMHNVADKPENAAVLKRMKKMLLAERTSTGDSRLGSNPEIWESYPRLDGKMRVFPKID